MTTTRDGERKEIRATDGQAGNACILAVSTTFYDEKSHRNNNTTEQQRGSSLGSQQDTFICCRAIKRSTTLAK